MHVAEGPQCTAGFERKAAFSDTLMGTISLGYFPQAYLRMPSFPMTVL
jgi:hypothetical protein